MCLWEDQVLFFPVTRAFLLFKTPSAILNILQKAKLSLLPKGFYKCSVKGFCETLKTFFWWLWKCKRLIFLYEIDRSFLKKSFKKFSNLFLQFGLPDFVFFSTNLAFFFCFSWEFLKTRLIIPFIFDVDLEL